MTIRKHFVFLNACGCPFGLAEKTSSCRDEDTAWRQMYEGRAGERAAAARGVHVQLVDHDRYVRDFYPLMFQPCPHLAEEAS